MFGFLPEDQRPLPLLEAARQPFCSYVEILSFCISEFLWTNKFIDWVTWLSASSCLIWQEEDTTYLNQCHLSLFFQNIILFIHTIARTMFSFITWVFSVLNLPNCPSWEAMVVQLLIMSSHSKCRKSTTFFFCSKFQYQTGTSLANCLSCTSPSKAKLFSPFPDGT